MTEKPPIITALTPAQVAKALAAVSGNREVTAAMVQADIKAGAPVNPDGTVHLVCYIAWLAKEVVHGD